TFLVAYHATDHHCDLLLAVGIVHGHADRRARGDHAGRPEHDTGRRPRDRHATGRGSTADHGRVVGGGVVVHDDDLAPIGRGAGGVTADADPVVAPHRFRPGDLHGGGQLPGRTADPVRV